MAMGGGPPLHRRPRGAGAAETTSWAVGGAPHMSPSNSIHICDHGHGRRPSPTQTAPRGGRQ
jgi:hypothetical protein